jgi:hypothetical protein
MPDHFDQRLNKRFKPRFAGDARTIHCTNPGCSMDRQLKEARGDANLLKDFLTP